MMFGRFDNLKYIQTLDPQTDYEKIVKIVGTLEYPWLLKKSLEFALFRTYAVPHTSRILAATGQFVNHGQKRYDDTSLMLAGIAEHGIDSPFGQQVIQRMNQLHGRWNIRNEDMLYVLSAFIFEPTRWHNQYSWRKPTRKENLANYYFWKEVGTRMGIKDIPDTYEAYEQFNLEHEKNHFSYDDANHLIASATIDIFLSWYPKFLRPLVRQGILAFLDDPLLEAMGFKKPNALFGGMVRFGLMAFGKMMRFMPPRRKPYLFTALPNRSYPQGFKPQDLGARYETDEQAAGD
jgi:hypothetical protein